MNTDGTAMSQGDLIMTDTPLFYQPRAEAAVR